MCNVNGNVNLLVWSNSRVACALQSHAPQRKRNLSKLRSITTHSRIPFSSVFLTM